MALVSLALGIIMILAVQFAWTTIGPFRAGFIFAAISLVLLLIARDEAQNSPKISKASIVINIISTVLNLIIALIFVGH